MFLNALMLLGIGAAVVPWVLHLLSRARYRNVNWGAMMFLDADDGGPRQSRRMSQVLLLGVRAAVVALLAVALARPALNSAAPAPAKGQAVIAVILLDCSSAMGVEENGHPRMVLARGAAKQVLGLHKGDRVALMLMGQKQPAAERVPTADLWDVARRIESTEAGNGVIDIARELKAAVDGIEGRDEAGVGTSLPPKAFLDFYVIGASQASAWRGVNAAFGDSLRRQLRGEGVNYRLFAIPIGAAEAEDVAVESIALLNPPVIVNQPADFEITARNYGGVRWAGVPLTVTTAGPERAADRSDRGRLKVLDQSINIAPHSVATFRATATFRTPGSHVISANLHAGNLPADDRFDLAVEVGEPTRVLIITGDAAHPDPAVQGTPGGGSAAGTGGPAGAAACLQLALAPFRAAHQGGADPNIIDAESADVWAGPTVSLGAVNLAGHGSDPQQLNKDREAQLSAYQVVILSNVEQFTPRQSVALEQFVYDGGGVLIAPGPLSRPEAYDSSLYRDGAGIMPAALKDATAADGSEQTSLSGAELSHPVFRFMAGRPDLLLSATVDRYFPLGPHAAGARELSHYVSGDPFLVESTAGKGRVLLMTTSLGTDWTSLPLSSFYLPFVQSAVRYLAETSTVQLKLNLQPGEPIEMPLDESSSQRAVTVITPEGEPRSAEVTRTSDPPVARFTDTDAPGVYQVRVSDTARPYTRVFVVRPPSADADPSPLSPERWGSLARDVGFEKLDPAEHPLEASLAAESGRQELWRWALGGVLGLALLEMALGRMIARVGS